MVSRHQGGINTLRQVSLTALSLIEQPLANIRDYRQALNTNTYLQKQNVLLQDELSRLRAIEQENQELRRMLGFQSVYEHDLHPVLIIGKHLKGLNNFLTIDAGSDDSVSIGMPLVTSDGLVGRIVLTNDDFSQVMPYYNSLFKVSARIQENNASGIVSWAGTLYGELVMDFVPNTTNVDSGFVVETSGYGNQIPAGIPIGVVSRTEPQEGKETQQIYLRPYVQLAQVVKGFVIQFQADTSITKLKEEYNEMFE
ncbi:MAG: rod shape-determining protein MreC [Balneolaceae bacterium]|nr:rod shape-determining protein MreC [Balneolaceae bacterium]